MNLFGLLFAGAGAVVFYFGFAQFKKVQFIENIPTSKVRSIAMGLVELKGKAIKAAEELASPVSKTNCVYYEYKIEEWRKSGKSSEWRDIYRETKVVPFYLQDDTGKVLVDLNGVEAQNVKSNWFIRKQPNMLGVIFQKSVSYEDGQKVEEKEMSETSFLSAMSVLANSARYSNSRLRFTEHLIPSGADIYLLGNAASNGAAHLQNQDGIIVKKGSSEPFIVSTELEKKLTGSMKLTAFAILGFGAIFILVGAWLLIK